MNGSGPGNGARTAQNGPGGRDPPYIKAILDMLEMDGKLLGSKLAEWKEAGFDTSSLEGLLERPPGHWVPAFMLFNTGVIAIHALVEGYEDPEDGDLDKRAVQILGWMTDTRDINRSLDAIMGVMQTPGSPGVPPIVKKFFADPTTSGLRAVLPESLFGELEWHGAAKRPAGLEQPITPQIFDDGRGRPDSPAADASRAPRAPSGVAPVVPRSSSLGGEHEGIGEAFSKGWERMKSQVAARAQGPKGMVPGAPVIVAEGSAGPPVPAIAPECRIPDDAKGTLPGPPRCLVDSLEANLRTFFLALRLVELLLSRVDRAGLYEVLEKYERFGWISESTRISLMTMARGMKRSPPGRPDVRVSARIGRATADEKQVVQGLFLRMFARDPVARPMGLFLTDHSTVLWFLAKMAGVNIVEDDGHLLGSYVEAMGQAYSPA